MSNEAHSRVKVNAPLEDQDCGIQNPITVPFRPVLSDRTNWDYAHRDREVRPVTAMNHALRADTGACATVEKNRDIERCH